MLFRRRRFDRELKQEIDAHLAEREAAYIRDGMPPSDARRRAALDFGNATLVHEQSRDVWLVRWLENVKRDTRVALRMLRSAPGFAAAAILTLALGIGANTAIFSIVDGLLLRPLPYRDPSRLVHVQPGFPTGALLILREQGRHFESIGGYTPNTEVTWTGGPEPLRIKATVVSGELFSVLGVAPERGRTVEQADERKGAEPIAVLSHAFWQRYFGGDAGVVGRTLTINDRARRVAGVMPRGFRFPDAETDVWIPATIDPSNAISLWATTGMQYVGRLKPDATAAIAQTDVPRLAALVRDGFPWPMPREFGLTTRVVALQQSTVAGVRDAVLLLAGAVALVLMIACANVATLLLARSEARGRELAVRGALGAGRGRLALQLLLESGIIALAGAGAAVAVLFFALPALAAALPADVPRVRDFTIDPRAAIFAAGAALLTTLLIGVLPARQASRADLTTSLRAGDTRAGRRSRAFNILVAAEIALALVLVTGAGALLRSLINVTAVDPGFNPAGLAAARVHPILSRYPEPPARIELYRRLVERVGALPGVQRAAATSSLPLEQPTWLALAIEDHPVAEGAPAWTADQRHVTDNYFDVMGIPLREGRTFDSRDTMTAPGAIVINETMARRYWPGKSAVGRRLRPVWQPQWRTIVGVVADVRNRGLDEPVVDEIYTPYAQNPNATMVLIARSSLDPSQTAAAIRTVVGEIDPQAPVGDAGPAMRVLEEAVAGRRFLLRAIGAFAIVALALGAIGIYGVTAYGVAKRTREIGLRLALGGTRRAVIAELLRQSVQPVGIGLLLGLAGALASGRVMGGMLYEASAYDPVVLAAVVSLLAATALAATVMPALRATRVDPASALRSD